LITKSNSDIEKLISRFENQIKQIKHEIFRISWYMRGGVSSTDLFYLYSYEDREILANIIDENLKASQEAGLPLI
jgi:hypothetical protein